MRVFDLFRDKNSRSTLHSSIFRVRPSLVMHRYLHQNSKKKKASLISWFLLLIRFEDLPQFWSHSGSPQGALCASFPGSVIGMVKQSAPANFLPRAVKNSLAPSTPCPLPIPRIPFPRFPGNVLPNLMKLSESFQKYRPHRWEFECF
jgi:hypothetical protein